MIDTLKQIWRRFCLFGVEYDKLHLGSGAVILPGWLNIDFDSSLASGIYPLDIRNPLPFPDNSISVIFSEHLIEHLSKKDGLELLKECRRVLKPYAPIRFGGRILISILMHIPERIPNIGKVC